MFIYMHIYTHLTTHSISSISFVSLRCAVDVLLRLERAYIVGRVPQVFKGLPVQAFSLIPVFPVLFIPNFILIAVDKVLQNVLSPIYGAPLLPELDLAK